MDNELPIVFCSFNFLSFLQAHAGTPTKMPCHHFLSIKGMYLQYCDAVKTAIFWYKHQKHKILTTTILLLLCRATL